MSQVLGSLKRSPCIIWSRLASCMLAAASSAATCLLVGGVLLGSQTAARAVEPTVDAALPTVVLLGDSIRLSYAPVVVKRLAGRANIVSPKPNGGDSANELRNLEAWAIRVQPAVVHFNCGIHDVKKSKSTGAFQVSPVEYEANLRKIVARLRNETKAVVLFALTTPLVDDRAAKGRAERDYELLDASTKQYNDIALRVMKELDVPVDDLRAALGTADEQAKLISADGVHFTAAGTEKLGAAAAAFIAEHLPTAKPK